MSEKKLGGHHACLGDIAQNMLKWTFFAHFLRGTWDKFYKSWFKLNKFQSFQLKFTKYQFNCIIFVKEQ